jgi:hypothetical protein
VQSADSDFLVYLYNMNSYYYNAYNITPIYYNLNSYDVEHTRKQRINHLSVFDKVVAGNCCIKIYINLLYTKLIYI